MMMFACLKFCDISIIFLLKLWVWIGSEVLYMGSRLIIQKFYLLAVKKMGEEFIIKKKIGTLEFGPRHQILRFEIPILWTGDAVTKLRHKCSFENPGLETSDAHQYAPEKKTFFSQFHL